jgi:hypothetical protein
LLYSSYLAFRTFLIVPRGIFLSLGQKGLVRDRAL